MPETNFIDFSGGINTEVGTYLQDTGNGQGMFYVDDAANFKLGADGIKTTPAFRTLSSLGAAGQGLFSHNGVLLACFNGSIASVNTTTGALTSLHTGASLTALWKAEPFKDKLVLMNGVNKPLQFNGTAISEITFTDPNTIWADARPASAFVFRNRLFYLGNGTSNPDAVYAPRPETIGDFDDTDGTVDFFSVAPGYGGKITGGMAITSDYAAIYKEGCIYGLSGNAPFGSTGGEPFRLTPITNDTGCLAPQSLVARAKEHYFLTDTGMQRLSTTEKFGSVETEQPHYGIRKLTNQLNFDPAVIGNAVAVYNAEEDSILLASPTKSTVGNTFITNYDLSANTIDARTGYTPTAMAVHKRKLYTVDSNGKLLVHGHDEVQEGLVKRRLVSKWIVHDGLSSLKQYRKLTLALDARNQINLSVRYQVLREGNPMANVQSYGLDNQALWDEAIWDVSTWAIEKNVFSIHNLGKGKAIRFEILSDSNGGAFTIPQMSLDYRVCGAKRS